MKSKLLKIAMFGKFKEITDRARNKMIETQAPLTTKILDYLHKKPNIADFVHNSLNSDDPRSLKTNIPMALGSTLLPSEKYLKNKLFRGYLKTKKFLNK